MHVLAIVIAGFLVTPTVWAEPSQKVGVEERLGQKVPLNLRFLDEEGHEFPMESFIDRPTLLLPVFFSCTSACPIMLSNLAQILGKISLVPGRDFRVITWSFDSADTPESANKRKMIFGKLITGPFPLQEWKFLTGNAENNSHLGDAIGFQFLDQGSGRFVHPNMMLVLGREGKIIRYLYGPEFLPFDVSMALIEAERGTPSLSIRKLLGVCFSYDPAGRRYVFNALRVFGTVTLVLVGLFVLIFLRRRNKAVST